jgi:selenocysteine lyase/cysteine desulfurase
MSIYEHNSNALPWREAGAIIELVPLNDQCQLDFEAFEEMLGKYKNYNSLKVAAMSAGNNIMGTLVDVDRIAVLCHKYGTLACLDYAAVAPYVPINMQGVTPDLAEYCGFKPIDQKDWGLTYKDAVYFSPHKLIGGP